MPQEKKHMLQTHCHICALFRVPVAAAGRGVREPLAQHPNTIRSGLRGFDEVLDGPGLRLQPQLQVSGTVCGLLACCLILAGVLS